MIKVKVTGLSEDRDEINAVLDLIHRYHPELIKMEAKENQSSLYYIGRLDPPRWAKKAEKRTAKTGRSLEFMG